jgi:hypothetical protein
MPRPSALSPSPAAPLPPRIARRPAQALARALRIAGWTLAATVAVGCEPAQSSGSNQEDTMFFGLFKSKSPSTVDPSVGAALVREAAFPKGEAQPPVPAYPQVRRVSLTAAPPEGRVSPTDIEQNPADAYILEGAAGTTALVNTYKPKRRCELWELDPKDPTRLVRQLPLPLEADMSKWVMYGVGDAIALPAHRLLIQVRSFVPNPVDRAYVVDMRAGTTHGLGIIRPDWPAGLPFHFLDSLPLAPDAVLAVYRTDDVRLGPQRYVNRFDHLMLFSPRHPDGVEIARIGIDDGNVRGWRFSGHKLWLQTSDDRGDSPKQFVWSLDLSRVL